MDHSCSDESGTASAATKVRHAKSAMYLNIVEDSEVGLQERERKNKGTLGSDRSKGGREKRVAVQTEEMSLILPTKSRERQLSCYEVYFVCWFIVSNSPLPGQSMCIHTHTHTEHAVLTSVLDESKIELAQPGQKDKTRPPSRQLSANTGAVEC
jgi:hypothetical protein